MEEAFDFEALIFDQDIHFSLSQAIEACYLDFLTRKFHHRQTGDHLPPPTRNEILNQMVNVLVSSSISFPSIDDDTLALDDDITRSEFQTFLQKERIMESMTRGVFALHEELVHRRRNPERTTKLKAIGDSKQFVAEILLQLYSEL